MKWPQMTFVLFAEFDNQSTNKNDEKYKLLHTILKMLDAFNVSVPYYIILNLIVL